MNRNIRTNLLFASAALISAHVGYVTELEKNRASLLEEWGSQDWKVGLIHGAFGAGGEVGEIVQAIVTNDVKGLLKELGDASFYTQLVIIAAKQGAESIGVSVNNESESSFCIHSFIPARDLQVLCGDLMDSVKKVCFYNQPLTDHIGNIIDSARSFQLGLALAAEQFGFSADDIIIGNVRKLKGIDLSTEGARYANGYSDDAARDRADENDQRCEIERKLHEELAELTPPERIERLRPIREGAKSNPYNYGLYDVRSGKVIDAIAVFGSEFGPITFDEVAEHWSQLFPEGLDIDRPFDPSPAHAAKDAGDDSDLNEALPERQPEACDAESGKCEACE